MVHPAASDFNAGSVFLLVRISLSFLKGSERCFRIRAAICEHGVIKHKKSRQAVTNKPGIGMFTLHTIIIVRDCEASRSWCENSTPLSTKIGRKRRHTLHSIVFQRQIGYSQSSGSEFEFPAASEGRSQSPPLCNIEHTRIDDSLRCSPLEAGTTRGEASESSC